MPPSASEPPVFQVALTGDFLDDAGKSAYGDIGLDLLAAEQRVTHRFILEHAPRAGDAEYWRRFYSMEVAPEHIAGVHGFVVLRPWVRRSTFAHGADDLTVIGRSGAGYDKIDVQACTDNDVALFNAPHALNHSTASSALLFMLALAKRLFAQDRVAREGRWDRQAQVMGSEIEGRTLGIIGLGHSGRELVRLAAPFAMGIIAFSPHADPAKAVELGVRLTDLDDVLRESDFVSLHCRLTPETRGLLDASRLALMKPDACLINVARGELVDQAALVEALRERRIAGAALDVFEEEPLAAGDPLLALDNVIVTPHWSASTSDVWRATGRAMAEGMLRAAQGEAPENVINREVLGRPGFLKKLGRFARPRPPLAFDRWTDDARKTMALARREAEGLCHEAISPEHILLGLLRPKRRSIVPLLRALGIAAEAIRSEVLKVVVRGTTHRTTGTMPFTPRAKHVLEEAHGEADSLGHRYIEPAHLLLGILREGTGATGDALRAVGMSLEAARAELLKALA